MEFLTVPTVVLDPHMERSRLERQASDAVQAFDDAVRDYFFTVPVPPPSRWRPITGVPGSITPQMFLSPEPQQALLGPVPRCARASTGVPSSSAANLAQSSSVSVSRRNCSITLEVLVRVIHHLASDAASVVAISQVSSTWRRTLFSIPDLIAFWDDWPIPFLETWHKIAKGNHTIAKLRERSLHRWQNRGRFRRLVRSAQPAWKELDISLATDYEPTSTSHRGSRLIRSLLDAPMPSLWNLSLSFPLNATPSTIEVHSRSVPLLEVLHLEGTLLVPAPFADHQRLSSSTVPFSCLDRCSLRNVTASVCDWMTFFQGIPNVSAIEIFRSSVSDDTSRCSTLGPPARAAVPVFHLCALTMISSRDSPAVFTLLMSSRSSFPNLRTLKVKGSASLAAEQWNGVVSPSFLAYVDRKRGQFIVNVVLSA